MKKTMSERTDIKELYAKSLLKWKNPGEIVFGPCAFCVEAIEYRRREKVRRFVLCNFCQIDKTICDISGGIGLISAFHGKGDDYGPTLMKDIMQMDEYKVIVKLMEERSKPIIYSTFLEGADEFDSTDWRTAENPKYKVFVNHWNNIMVGKLNWRLFYAMLCIDKVRNCINLEFVSEVVKFIDWMGEMGWDIHPNDFKMDSGIMYNEKKNLMAIITPIITPLRFAINEKRKKTNKIL